MNGAQIWITILCKSLASEDVYSQNVLRECEAKDV